jgi:hypothetical protein
MYVRMYSYQPEGWLDSHTVLAPDAYTHTPMHTHIPAHAHVGIQASHHPPQLGSSGYSFE